MGPALGAVLLVAALAAPGALAQGRTAAEVVLGGSFFPFERSFPAAQSPRCRKLAERLRGYRSDNILNVEDVRRLRSNGCRNFRFYD